MLSKNKQGRLPSGKVYSKFKFIPAWNFDNLFTPRVKMNTTISCDSINLRGRPIGVLRKNPHTISSLTKNPYTIYRMRLRIFLN